MDMTAALAGVCCKVKFLKLFLNLGWTLPMEKEYYIIQNSSCFSYPGYTILWNDKSFCRLTSGARLPHILFPSVNNRLTKKQAKHA